MMVLVFRTSGVTQAVLDYLLWHHLGPDYTERAHDLINVYTHYFNGHVQPANMAKLVEQFIWRSDIPLDRTGATLEVSSYLILARILIKGLLFNEAKCIGA